VEVRLDVARDDAAERADELVDLARVRAADRVGNADPVDADLVDGPVEVEQVDKVGPERVLGRETDLDALGLDVLDDWRRTIGWGGVSRWRAADRPRKEERSLPSRAVFSM
jgi:hypothetical protein